MTKKSHSTYTRVIHKDLTQTIQEISITIAWSPLWKPSFWNQFEFRHFSAYSLFTKKFLILNFEWLDTKLLELIYIVSSDYRADVFSYSFAVVYGHRAELSISSNDYCSLVTWQMPLFRVVLLVPRDPSKLFDVPSVY